ncbi:MAG TPA: hemerythrin domain-containing protein [Pyrinomonadaceae bacterium]|nr:hemerythrin domain-containing protein [Pyrinomonadaceae bacterium]
MDAFTLLKNDHKKVAALFEEIEPTTERALKTREEAFGKLKEELDVHAHIEEKILYPALKKEAETRDITFEGLEEHHVIKLLLAELAGVAVDSEEWTAKAKVLQENVEHHVEEEETKMFKLGREVLTQEQIEDLGTRLEAEKNKVVATAATA